MDLNVDPSLQIDIPDALSERDKVKFTVHTKVSEGGGSVPCEHRLLLRWGSGVVLTQPIDSNLLEFFSFIGILSLQLDVHGKF